MKILPMSVGTSQNNCMSYANVIVGLLRPDTSLWPVEYDYATDSSNLAIQEIEDAAWSNFKPADWTGS